VCKLAKNEVQDIVKFRESGEGASPAKGVTCKRSRVRIPSSPPPNLLKKNRFSHRVRGVFR
jgi:hypothetical protein